MIWLRSQKNGVEIERDLPGLYLLFEGPHGEYETFKSPYRPGDILYVPETWKCSPDSQLWADNEYRVIFKDGKMVRFFFGNQERLKKWRKYIYKPLGNWQSPYFMPREAARIFLRATDVRVERLQNIDDEGAKAEGANWRNGKNAGWQEKMCRSAIDRFA